MKKISLAFGLCALLNASDFSQVEMDRGSIKSSLSLGSLQGQAREYVYEEGYKISQLNWKTKRALILKGDLSYDILPWLTLNFNGYTTIKSGKGNMSDYDWADDIDREKITDESHHENTRLNYSNEFDLNTKAWFFDSFGLKTAFVAGYKESRFSWSSKGGTYRYTDENTKQIDTGTFDDDMLVIGYAQKFKTPYFGFALNYNYNKFELTSEFKHSRWVSSQDIDEHYVVNKTSKSSGKNSKFYGVNLNAGYNIDKNLKIFADFNYNKYSHALADITTHDKKKNTSETDKNGAGLSNKHSSITLGISYKF